MDSITAIFNIYTDPDLYRSDLAEIMCDKGFAEYKGHLGVVWLRCHKDL